MFEIISYILNIILVILSIYLCWQQIKLTRSSFIGKFFKEIDNDVKEVIDPRGRIIEFRVGEIIKSLILSGVDFYTALRVIFDIRDKLEYRMTTKRIKELVIKSLENIDKTSTLSKRYDLFVSGNIYVEYHGDARPLKYSLIKERLYEIIKAGNIPRNVINRVVRRTFYVLRIMQVKFISLALLDNMLINILNDEYSPPPSLMQIVQRKDKEKMKQILSKAEKELRSAYEHYLSKKYLKASQILLRTSQDLFCLVLCLCDCRVFRKSFIGIVKSFTRIITEPSDAIISQLINEIRNEGGNIFELAGWCTFLIKLNNYLRIAPDKISRFLLFKKDNFEKGIQLLELLRKSIEKIIEKNPNNVHY
mgnify:CR=1 FL=1